MSYTENHSYPAAGTTPGAVDNPDDSRVSMARLFWACFWCLPMGVYAVHLATQIDKRGAAGDVRGAAQAAAGASRWSAVAVWTGVVLTILTLLSMCGSGVEGSSY